MIWRHLYLQLCAIFVISLFVFAAIATFIWSASGHDHYENALFQKTTAIASMLLPDANASETRQVQAVEEISEALDMDITLWSADSQLITASGNPSELTDKNLKPGQWTGNAVDTQYMTILQDGRGLVIDLDRVAVPSDSYSVALSMLFLALIITLAVYPIIRRVTRRLERLQRGVERIGAGNLGARVDVEGNDEVAILARSFNKAAQQIETLVNAQRLLLAHASHELRTPLARIRLGIEMLQKEDDSDRREALKDDIQEIDELVDELILMTRIDTNIDADSFQTTHLMAIAAEECARYEDCTVSGDAAEIFGDPRLIQHLVRNLLDNAFAHGTAPVEVVIHANKAAVELSVIDSGEGIPESERENVFQPFYRGPDKQNTPGSGLGLPLVRKIAEAHRGSVLIDSSTISAVRVQFLSRPHDHQGEN